MYLPNLSLPKLLAVYYGFGNALGLGFSNSFLKAYRIDYCIGIWGSDNEKGSSNYKELKNCIMALCQQAEAGALTGSEVFTNNSTAELAIYWGSAASPRLQELLIELKVLQALHGFRLFVCYCAGMHMIAQGTDGGSLRQLNEGVMNGTNMMSFILLHQDTTAPASTIEHWIRSWLEQDAKALAPVDWFEWGYKFAGVKLAWVGSGTPS
jgi:hypothetical protein